ncbi:MAG: ABC transporter ATP-binding protein [Flavobacteriales bacterium]
MIEIKLINKAFADNHVLKNVSTVFDRGKTNMIIGQSGSGKSVLAKCIVGLHEIDTGEILYDGRNFTKMSRNEKKELRKEIGMLFQGGALFDSLTVEENISFPLTMFTKMSKSEIRDRANFCLERVALEGKNKLYPSEISGGMQKRVGIARAIALNPKYLFCDEPNSGLDPRTAILIDNLIHEITVEYQMTTVIISHDMNSVFEIGEKIMFIFEGQNWWEGDKDTIILTNNKEINDFVYASKFIREFKDRHRK